MLNIDNFIIHKTKKEDFESIQSVLSNAFGNEEGDVIVELVENLLNDSTAKPLLSLLAFENKKPVGYILFTKASIVPNKNKVSATILAPVGVIPEYQKKGIGSKLIKEGLKHLSKAGTKIVFVLGFPKYYSKHGFSPAGCQGLEAPYPIPEKNSDAWMVQSLMDYDLEDISGKVGCAKSMDKAEYWVE